MVIISRRKFKRLSVRHVHRYMQMIHKGANRQITAASILNTL